MPRSPAYSDDLRWALWHMRYVTGLSVDEIVTATGLAKRTVQRFFSEYLRTHAVERARPEPVAGARSVLNEHDLRFLRATIEHSPDAYLDEMKKQLEDVAGISVSISTVWRALRRMGFTLKKLLKSALERNETRRCDYIYHIGATYEPNQLVFGDESSFDRRTTYRGYAWALKGRRAHRKLFYVRGKRYSILPAISLNGILHCEIVEGSFNTARFYRFVEALLDKMQPYPAPNSVLVLDNCSIHKAPEIRQLIESRGMRLEFLPAYSPDFNPIEQAFSVIKSLIRREHPDFARSNSTGTSSEDHTEVLLMLYSAVYSITADYAARFFHHSGYI